MNSEAYHAARDRYGAAYDAYRACAKRVLETFQSGAAPTADDITEEARAAEILATRRRELIEVIAALRPLQR